jgi:hypothetical protein
VFELVAAAITKIRKPKRGVKYKLLRSKKDFDRLVLCPRDELVEVIKNVITNTSHGIKWMEKRRIALRISVDEVPRRLVENQFNQRGTFDASDAELFTVLRFFPLALPDVNLFDGRTISSHKNLIQKFGGFVDEFVEGNMKGANIGFISRSSDDRINGHMSDSERKLYCSRDCMGR